MKRRKKRESFNEKYTQELESSITFIMPKLIEAFIHIYGEKHRDFIIRTISSLNFVFFISDKLINTELEEESLGKQDRDILKMVSKYQKRLEKRTKNIPPEQIRSFLIKNYFPKYPFTEYELEIFMELLDEGNPSYTFICNKDETEIYKVIFLPIFTIDMGVIVHEINHALMIENIGYTKDAIIDIKLFPTFTSEELANEYISSLVIKEYQKVGGIIPKSLTRFYLDTIYRDYEYMMEYLFAQLKPLILESAITRNHNLFYKKVGIEKVEYMGYLIDILVKSFNEDVYIELLNVINEMAKSAMASKDEDYESFYQELEKKGFQVRKLKKQEGDNL